MSDVGYNIGHLISESSFQTLDSPWTSPKHFYSLTESDHGSTSSRRFLQNGHNDDGYGHQDMPADSFRPAIVPIITSEKRTSSLTSLLKTDAWSSPSMRNNEKRRQQYGDHDSSDSENGIAYPAIGENSLNMAVVMSSGRRKSTGTDEDGSRDKIGGTNVRERRVNREERRDGGRGLGFNEEHDDDSDNSDELNKLTDAKAEKFIGTLGDSSYEEALLISSQNNVKNDRRNDGYHPDDAEEMQAQEAMFGCILEAQSRHMAHRRSVAMATQTPAGSQLTKNQDAFNRENSHSPVIHHNQSSQAFNLAVSTSLSAVLGSGSMSGTGSVPVSRLTSGSGSGSVSGIFNSALAASGIGIGLGSGSCSGSGTVSSYRTSATPSESSSQKDIEESSVRDYQATGIKDPRSRGKGKREVPLVSAMRNKKASSTEIAMARVRVASSAVNEGYSSESEDSSDDDDDDGDDLSGTRADSRYSAERDKSKSKSNKDSLERKNTKNGMCFNFDLKSPQKTMLERMREKEKKDKKGKKKRGSVGVRFNECEGEIPCEYEYTPSDTITPFSTVPMAALDLDKDLDLRLKFINTEEIDVNRDGDDSLLSSKLMSIDGPYSSTPNYGNIGQSVGQVQGIGLSQGLGQGKVMRGRSDSTVDDSLLAFSADKEGERKSERVVERVREREIERRNSLSEGTQGSKASTPKGMLEIMGKALLTLFSEKTGSSTATEEYSSFFDSPGTTTSTSTSGSTAALGFR